ncbi:metalloregulator ArsR/SmtB family transcription factor [Massilia sp. R798]|uniref:Metalloregulator ArsR/SmtB family transcription factor n=2 Tax=Massilia soli TaxID=2792854 RepID=A0ABS7SKQ0_9BURK|nr:metalloregulator ArsR/SmtB family transcription factor [Massilia soli]
MSKSCSSPVTLRTASPDIDVEDLARMCKALSHPARVQLFRHLLDYGECYFGSLADVLPLAPSTISKHISILKDAGLIEGSSDVQRVCYCVNQERLQQFKRVTAGL